MKVLFNGLVVFLTICFPVFLWFVGWQYPVIASIYLIVLGGLKYISRATIELSSTDWAMVVVPILIGLAVLIVGSDAGLYYPVIVNACLLGVFSSSLYAPKNVIQQIAEKMEGRALDAAGLTYTRNVTRIWCVFFILNISISIYLIWSDLLKLWTLYNGLISYILVGMLLLGERLIRPLFRSDINSVCSRKE